MAGFLAISFYFSMVVAAYCCQYLFSLCDLIPEHVGPVMAKMTMTPSEIPVYTNFLNVIALILSAFLFKRFYKTGGLEMLKDMDNPGAATGDHCCH